MNFMVMLQMKQMNRLQRMKTLQMNMLLVCLVIIVQTILTMIVTKRNNDELLTQIYTGCLFSTCNQLFEPKVNPQNNHA